MIKQEIVIKNGMRLQVVISSPDGTKADTLIDIGSTSEPSEEDNQMMDWIFSFTANPQFRLAESV